MTPETNALPEDRSGRSGLGQERDSRAVAVARLAIGLGQGLALFGLYRAHQGLGGEPVWPANQPMLFAALVLVSAYLPVVLLAGVGRLRLRTLIAWGVIAAVALGLLALHDVTRATRVDEVFGSFVILPFAAVALFITHHLIVPADQVRRRVAPFHAYFDTAWMAGVQLVLSIGFTGALWLLLFLGSALFKVIGLSFLGDLISESWFALPVTSLAFATAVHLTDVREGLIRGVRTVALMLLSWLLLVLTVLVAGFLAALPFTGLEGLWRTGSATALVLSAAAALIILINTAYQDGRPDNLPPAVLRAAVRVASVLLTPLILIAVWGLSLRIGQHGLTPERIIACACALVGAAYAVGYGVAALRPLIRPGARWMKPLEPTNIAVAILTVAVILALFSPLADPARMSAADQVARLTSGKVAPDRFDYAFLRFESGKAGDRALKGLEASPNPEIARRAREARAADAAYELSSPPPETPAFKPVVEAWPETQTLPPTFVGSFKGSGMLAGCRDKRDCVATQIDLNGDGQAEILMATAHFIVLYARSPDDSWYEEGSYTALRCSPESSEDARDLLRAGKIQPRPSAWPDLDTGGRHTSQLNVSGPCRGPAAARPPAVADPGR